MVEIPSWAWGLLTAVLGGGMTAITGVIWHFARRLELRLDNHDKRIGKTEVAVARLEARL